MDASAEAPVTVIVTERRGFRRGFASFIQSIASLVLRAALAIPIFLMAHPWWQGPLKLLPGGADLVASTFPVHVGRFTYALPHPEIAVWVIAFVEILGPAAIAIGFLTRIAAFLLLLLAILFYLANPQTWMVQQLPLCAIALALVAYGPGGVSFDHLIWHGRRR